MNWNQPKVAPEELIGVFCTESALNMCAECGEKELEIVKEKACGGAYFEVVRCKYREACQEYAKYNLGEGGVR